MEWYTNSNHWRVNTNSCPQRFSIFNIANRKPEEALKVLTSTELADLPPNLERQRRILQAQALIDSGRTVLALDILSGISGRDADRLRVEFIERNDGVRRVGATAAPTSPPEVSAVCITRD